MAIKLKPGDTIDGLPGASWNEFVDALGANAPIPTQFASLFKQAGIVLVKNMSGGARKRFDVLGIDDVFPSPAEQSGADPGRDARIAAFKNGPVLHGVTPTLEDHFANWAILLEPARDKVMSGDVQVAAEGIVPAVVSGLTVCRVNVVRGTDTFAEMDNGDTESLVSAPGGSAKILWKEAGLGLKLAAVRIGIPYGRTWGVLATTLATGSVAAMAPIQRTGNQQWTDSENVPTINVYAPPPQFLSGSETVITGTEVRAELFPDGLWYVTGAPCDE